MWIGIVPFGLGGFESADAVSPVVAMDLEILTDEFSTVSIVIGAIDEFEERDETLFPWVFSWNSIVSVAMAEEEIAEFHILSPYSMCS